MEKPKIFVTLPSYKEHSWKFTKCLIEMEKFMKADGYDLNYCWWGGTIIKKARNKLAQIFLEDTKDDYLFFIDDDTLFPMNGLFQLLQDDKDIVGGLYITRKQPLSVTTYKIARKGNIVGLSDYAKTNSLFEIDTMGMGFCLIKRHVLEKMKFPYFDEVAVNDQVMWGEDFGFCINAKVKYGFEIWCDSRIKFDGFNSLGHVGEYIYSLDDYFAEKNYLKEKEKKKEGKKCKEKKNEFTTTKNRGKKFSS